MLLYACMQNNCYSQNNFSAVDKQLLKLHQEKNFNGSVLVAKNGKVIYQRAVGLADFEHKVPLTSSSRFELASITKTFTAILVLQLAHEGKLKLEANISDYVPEFTRHDSGQITIHHLLSHTSGIQDFVGLNCDFAQWKEKEFFEGLLKTPIVGQPGLHFQYASSTYILLRFIIEKVTKKSFEDNLRDRILSVAGMTNSGIIHNRQIVPYLARGYESDGEIYHQALPIANHEIFIGASSMYSTTLDMLKFDRALYANILLPKAETKLMSTVVQPPYGYGWFIAEDSIHGKTLSHGGDIFGYTTLFERRLKDKITIVVLGNLQGIDREKVVAILDQTLKQEKK